MEAQACAGSSSRRGGATPPAFGAKIPYGDPAWYQEHISPYYNESHHRFRAAMREFVDKEVRASFETLVCFIPSFVIGWIYPSPARFAATLVYYFLSKAGSSSIAVLIELGNAALLRMG